MGVSTIYLIRIMAMMTVARVGEDVAQVFRSSVRVALHTIKFKLVLYSTSPLFSSPIPFLPQFPSSPAPLMLSYS
jgi:hypothetical protein